MPQVRLLGLVLFITSIFLAMAAAATHTTHIRFNQPAGDARGGNFPDSQAPDASILPPRYADQAQTGAANPPQFAAVPVVYPLLGAGVLGLLMWFVPATITPSKSRRQRRGKRQPRR